MKKTVKLHPVVVALTWDDSGVVISLCCVRNVRHRLFCLNVGHRGSKSGVGQGAFLFALFNKLFPGFERRLPSVISSSI